MDRPNAQTPFHCHSSTLALAGCCRVVPSGFTGFAAGFCTAAVDLLLLVGLLLLALLLAPVVEAVKVLVVGFVSVPEINSNFPRKATALLILS